MVRWGLVPEYEDFYSISDTGLIYSKHKCRYMSLPKDRDGYQLVGLSKYGTTKTYKVHRLVGVVFVEGYKEDLTINHIDSNKANNRSDNLEWMNRGLNARIATCRTVYLLDPNCMVVQVDCLREFCRNNNLNRSHLYAVRNGDRAHHKGWTWSGS
jgi:hypothetical protein